MGRRDCCPLGRPETQEGKEEGTDEVGNFWDFPQSLPLCEWLELTLAPLTGTALLTTHNLHRPF